MTTDQSQSPPAGVFITIGIIVLGLVAIGVMLVVEFASSEPSAEPLELSVQLEPVADGFDQPVMLTGANDGSGDRLVAEQRGRVLRLRPDGSVDPQPVLDIVDRVLHHHERGVLGLAVHPDAAENGRIFVSYSHDDDGATVISEFSPPADAEDKSIEDSERVLLTLPQLFTTHKAGMLAFDDDGMLLISTGDGGLGEGAHLNGQDRFSMLGKILRIDVDRGWPYAIPSDNGLAGAIDAHPEIHALGLRNPWRFSIDRRTGDLYIGDVGDRAWEEIDVLPQGDVGVSFGWSDMEGEDCFAVRDCDPSDHVAPALTYAHEDGETGHCAVVGGYAYRGSAGSLPDGTYLFADYCSRTIWGVPADQLRSGDASPTVVGLLPEASAQVLSFGEDDAGELYLLASSGEIFTISERPDEEPSLAPSLDPS